MIVQANNNQNVIPRHQLYDWNPETGTLYEVDDNLQVVRLGYCCVGVPAWAVTPRHLEDIYQFEWM